MRRIITSLPTDEGNVGNFKRTIEVSDSPQCAWIKLNITNANLVERIDHRGTSTHDGKGPAVVIGISRKAALELARALLETADHPAGLDIDPSLAELGSYTLFVKTEPGVKPHWSDASVPSESEARVWAASLVMDHGYQWAKVYNKRAIVKVERTCSVTETEL